MTHADSGEILFEGKDLCKLSAKEWTHLRATQISYVLQGDSLLPNFTVLENICLPHRLCGEYPDLEKQAMQLLEEFGMEAMAQDYPTNLSGGERRRVAVARAVVHQPKLGHRRRADQRFGRGEHRADYGAFPASGGFRQGGAYQHPRPFLPASEHGPLQDEQRR